MHTTPRRRARGLAAGAAVLAAVAVLTGCATAAVAAASAPVNLATGSQPAAVAVTFEWRTLDPMSGERVPPYVCPSDKPFLASGDHAAFGDALIEGVEVEHGSRGAAVTVTKAQTDQAGRPVGISSDPVTTSAANWSDQEARYRITLHCVVDSAAEATP